MIWLDVMLSLKKERKHLNWSLDYVALLLETSPAYVSRAERGLICPSIKFVCEYADILGTSVHLYGLSFL